MAITWETERIPEKACLVLAIVKDTLTGVRRPEILRAHPLANWPGEIVWERERDRAPLHDDEEVVAWVEMETEVGP